MAKISEDKLILNEDSPFQVQEAYKNLRTNVQFSLPADGCHVIGITSAGRGEGKSTTTVNLAISFAQLGKKVVVINCDLRLPTVAKKLNIPAKPGLSNYLTGNNTFKECFKVDKEHELYVLPSGDIPPDPTWLLQSEKMNEMIAGFRQKMDYVFLDLPPAGIVADAQMMSKVLDGYLLVVEAGVTTYSQVSEMVNSFKLVDAKILGFIGTMADKAEGRHYKSYYKKNYYSYGYENAANKSNKSKK